MLTDEEQAAKREERHEALSAQRDKVRPLLLLVLIVVEVVVEVVVALMLSSS